MMRQSRQHTSVETEPRPRHDKPCLETRHVSRHSITGNIKAELSQEWFANCRRWPRLWSIIIAL